MKINAKLYRVLLKIMIALVAIVIVGTVAFVITTIVGRNNLYGKNKGQGPNLAGFEQAEVLTEDSEFDDSEEQVTWQEGDVRYNGDIYRFNDDMLTFLFLGIDKKEEIQTVDDGMKGGQSDAIFLLTLNPHTEEISIIGIPRDTIADVDVYNSEGSFLATVPQQIALQHGYGDGGMLSCERSVKAVSRLFYDLPVHGYCAINMSGIPTLNDTIGGVEITALQDIYNSDIKEGDRVLLQGEKAFEYLHNRDITVAHSAEMRLARQKQYIVAYAAKAKEMMKQDITLPAKLYGTLSKYMVTDVTIDEVSYLATQVSGYSFDDDRIYTLQGEIEEVEGLEAFYADEESLYKLILDVFYEKITASE